MRPPVRALSAAEIKALDDVAANLNQTNVWHITERVFDLSRNAGEEALAQTYGFVAAVLQNAIDPNSVSDDEEALLRQVVDTAVDPALGAPLADLLWKHTADYKYAERAVDAYLAAAFRFRDAESWPPTAERYARAVALAASLGKKNARYLRAIATIEEYLRELDGTDPRFLSERLLLLLLEQRRSEPGEFAELAAKCAGSAEARGDFEMARRHWLLTARWLNAAKDAKRERAARLQAAECLVRQAESHVLGDAASFLNAASLLQHGMVMLQKEGAPQERLDELARMLKEYGTKSTSELKRVSAGGFDATEMMNDARAAVSGKSLAEAIVAFVALVDLPSRAKVRDTVLRNAKRFVMSHMSPRIALNRSGAAVAGRGSVRGDETEETENVVAQMHEDVVFGFSIQAQATLVPAWRQIQNEHGIDEQDMYVLVSGSWFVPRAREPYFARGLAAGFNDDLMVAIHLLVPQVEAVLRVHLQRIGVNTVTFNRGGYYEERDLNQLLAIPKAREFLGDRLHLALETLLVSRVAGNLRNHLAHGLIEPAACNSVLSFFFWALMLKLCVDTQRNTDRAENAATS